MNVDPAKIQAMISILQSMLESTNNDAEPEPQETVAVKTFSTTTSTKPKFINKFDNMMEKNMHKEDIAIDKQLRVHPPVPRTRTYEPLSVRCRVCGKEEKINPQVATSAEIERYKCNRCSISPG
jgi:hypothetical protein